MRTIEKEEKTSNKINFLKITGKKARE